MNVYAADTSTIQALPYFPAEVPAGFPSPASDYEEDRLDLNQHLIKNPPATYFVRATGTSMIGAGIHPGDLLIVDKSLEPKDGNVVIAVMNGEMTLKRIRIRKQRVWLEAENEDYAPLPISKEMDFQVWGVVKHVVHAL